MAQEFKPGEIGPQSGIYTITHDAAHADMPHEVTVIKGGRFRPAVIVRASASSSPNVPGTTSPRSSANSSCQACAWRPASQANTQPLSSFSLL
jgi:hypothetical protein